MQPENRDKAYFWDMLNAANAVESFCHGKGLSDYLSDPMLRGAVERNLEIIGEAGRRVSAKSKQAHPDIPWKSIIGQRNVLAHEYDALDHEAVWGVATRKIPGLIMSLRKIISDPEKRRGEVKGLRLQLTSNS